MPAFLAFVTRVADSFDIPSEDSLSLKLSMPEVVGFLWLLEDHVLCLGLVINLLFWVKSKGFELRILATEGTRTGFGMLVLSVLTLLDLSKLCVGLCLLEKMVESISFFCESNTFEKHPCLYCIDPVSKAHELELDKKL